MLQLQHHNYTIVKCLIFFRCRVFIPLEEQDLLYVLEIYQHASYVITYLHMPVRNITVIERMLRSQKPTPANQHPPTITPMANCHHALPLTPSTPTASSSV